MYELMNKIRDFVNGRCLLCYPVPSISQPAENDCSVLHASPTSVAYTVRKDSECRHGMQLVSVGSSPEKDGSGSLIEDLEADPRSQRTVPVQCSNSQEAPLDEKGAVSTTELKAEPEDKGSFPVHLTIPAENDDYRDEDKKLPVRPTQPKYRQNHQEVSPTTTKRSSRIMSNRLTFEIPQTMVAVRNTTETNVTPGLCERNEEFNSEKSRGSEIQIVDYENHCYEGYLISGYKRAGVGRFEYKHVGEDEDVDVVGNVSIYEGAFACGKMNGKGKLKHARGSIYEGEFKDGARHGKGECLYPKNQKLGTRFKYEGNWVQDERQGKGKFYQVDDANGEMYSGEWMEDKMQVSHYTILFDNFKAAQIIDLYNKYLLFAIGTWCIEVKGR